MSSINNNTSQRLTGFRAVLPFYILYDLDLNANHLRLYGQIEQMESNPDPSVQPRFSFQWFADQLGVDRRTVITLSNLLKKKGYIERIKISQNVWVWKTAKAKIIIEDPENRPKGSDPGDHHGSDPGDHLKIQEIKIQEKNIKPLVDFEKSPKVEKDYKFDLLFMLFYANYPNKQKPASAYKAFLRLKPTQALVDMLVDDVNKRLDNNWRGRDKSKIPHPSTYLNAREWEGEIYQKSPNFEKSTKSQWTVESVMRA